MGALTRLGLDHLALSESNADCSPDQDQTRSTFGFKWSKRSTYESEAVQAANREWLLQRYCSGDPNRLKEWLGTERKLVLDAGCGSGFSAILLLGELVNSHDYLGVDISDAVEIARQRFRERGLRGDFMKGDLSALPIPDESVDMILAEGVLHHTDDTEAAFKSLAGKLKPGGVFLVYVYAKKAVIREFTDDHIRANIRHLSDEQAWDALKPLTALGEALVGGAWRRTSGL